MGIRSKFIGEEFGNEIRHGECWEWNFEEKRFIIHPCQYKARDIGVKTIYRFHRILDSPDRVFDIYGGRLGVVYEYEPGRPFVFFAGSGNMERACAAFRLYFMKKRSELKESLRQINVSMTFMENDRRRVGGGIL